MLGLWRSDHDLASIRGDRRVRVGGCGCTARHTGAFAKASVRAGNSDGSRTGSDFFAARACASRASRGCASRAGARRAARDGDAGRCGIIACRDARPVRDAECLTAPSSGAVRRALGASTGSSTASGCRPSSGAECATTR